MKLLTVGSLALAAACLMTSASQAQQRDPYYRLTSEALGAGAALDVGQLPSGQWFGAMLPNGTGNGQNWYFISLGGDWYRMTNKWNGAGSCLDVDGEGMTYMDKCGAQIGQRWRVQRRGPTVTISNGFLTGRCLDVQMVGNTYAAKANPCNNAPGQRWTFTSTGVYP